MEEARRLATHDVVLTTYKQVEDEGKTSRNNHAKKVSLPSMCPTCSLDVP
jgi:hypothetical protein